MELALPTDSAEDGALSDQLARFVDSNTTGIGNVWIGINRMGRPGTMLWHNEFGRRVENIRWLPGEPNNAFGGEECVEFIPFRGYNDVTCAADFRLPYVCWG